MILSYYRRGAGEWPACVRCESGGLAGRQMLLDFEEDQLCVVREIRRNGSIGGRHPWAPDRRVWAGGGEAAAEAEWSGPGSPGDCA